MAERAYKLQDVKDFLKEYYNLDWRNFLIIKDGKSIAIKMRDFNQSCLRVPAVLYHGENEKKICWLSISNTYFSVYGYDVKDKNNHKNQLWVDFIAKEYNQEQGLNK